MVWGKADWDLGLNGREGASVQLAPIMPYVFVNVRFVCARVIHPSVTPSVMERLYDFNAVIRAPSALAVAHRATR